MFQERSLAVSSTSRPFSPLIPPTWTATTLGYLKDIEVRANKKPEVKKPNFQKNVEGGEPTFAEEEASLSSQAKGCPGRGSAVRSGDGCMLDRVPMMAFEESGPSRIQAPKSKGFGAALDPLDDKGDALFPSSRVPRSFTFWDWCATLVPNVLRTRTPFSAFLSFSLKLHRSDQPSTPQLFPVPVPFPGIFNRMPTGLSLRDRRRILLKRVLHVMVMALNFLHDGLRSFPCEKALSRCPSSAHRSIYRKIQGILAADGPGSGQIDVLSSGRRFPQLIARLGELSSIVTKLGACGPYGHQFQGHEVPLDSEALPELRPYRSLDSSRLKLSGTGAFDATEFLDDDLCMAYRCPDLILSCREPAPGTFPGYNDPPDEVLKLARIWDSQGLLRIHEVPQRSFWLSRVFNNYKSIDADRQIGDRRGRNFAEDRLLGPSSRLPSGSDLAEISLNARKQCLRVACTDRKDFYHQFRVSDDKAAANSVGPALREDQLHDLGKRRRRSAVGDMLHGDESWMHLWPRPPLLLHGEVYIAFGAIFQGDHGGVEFATQAHENLLKSVGLLNDGSRLEANRPISGSSLVEGLVIDDYFAISVEDRSLPPGESQSSFCFEQSQKVYDAYKILGTPHKDVKGEVRSKVCTQGVTTCGAPIAKRLSLSTMTLQLAQLSHTSDALHLCLLGAWTSVMLYRRPLMGIFAVAHSLVDASQVDGMHPKTFPLSRRVANELVVASALACLRSRGSV